MTIILYDLAGGQDQRFSGPCWRTRFALAHKGLAFETRPVRFTQIPGIAGGGQKTVPVLDDGGRIIGDSWAIATYLEETYPKTPSLFGGAQGRAYALFINNWMNVIGPLMLKVILLDLYARLDPADQSYFRESREKRFGKTLEAHAAEPMETRVAVLRAVVEPARAVLREQPFLSGAAPLYPDYLLAGYFMWARSMSPEKVLAEDDPLYAWFQRMLDLFGGMARKAPHEW